MVKDANKRGFIMDRPHYHPLLDTKILDSLAGQEEDFEDLSAKKFIEELLEGVGEGEFTLNEVNSDGKVASRLSDNILGQQMTDSCTDVLDR